MISIPTDSSSYPLPSVRRLRIYAFDPQASVELATAVINDAVIELPWETRWEIPLEKGPVNDFVEVIDYDPASGVFYAPVDLNHPVLLAQDGLPPSEGRPQFHQQMVFAVVMRTIRTFERALGRGVMWAADPKARKDKDPVTRNFTRRLRIYPHALREANAYYSPQKRALLFGYFRPNGDAKHEVDASWVFTCLSQDIIAHETTHAILHGMQRRSIEPSNIDALAFHEAFADIVALLQHFGMGKVLEHEIAQSRGSLRERGLLTGLGQQFGRATGRSGALRYAIDYLLKDDARIEQEKSISVDVQGKKTSEAEPSTFNETTEAHARGGFLVAAVFDAFVTIYERRTADLIRLAGASVVPRSDAALPPELVTRLASEAVKAADHVLRMCVRALDYIPPVDMRFGEYLRAIITADTDLVPDDPMRYRIAFVEAFRKRQIRVPGCISMAPDSLLWSPPDLADCPTFVKIASDAQDPLSAIFLDLLQDLQISVAFDKNQNSDAKKVAYNRSDFCHQRNLRELSMQVVLYNQRVIHKWFFIDSEADEDWEKLLGMRLLQDNHQFRTKPVLPMKSITCASDNTPKFEVHLARIARRSGPNGEEVHQLIIQMTQRRRAYFDPKEQEAADEGRIDDIGQVRWNNPDFWFRGGATLQVDLRDGRLLRIIRKRIDDDHRLVSERHFRTGDDTGAAMAAGDPEPFAFMHRSRQ